MSTLNVLRHVLPKTFTASLLVVCATLAGCGNDYGVDQQGQKIAAERIDKHWLVINYWADWCAPCRAEIPGLNTLASQLKSQDQGKGATVLGVNFDGLQGDDLRQASKSLGIQFTVLANDPAPLYDLPTSEGLPATYIVDPKGQLRAKLLGEQTVAAVSQKLAELQAVN